MELNNPYEALVHHLLIGRMVGLGYKNRFLMVSVIVCMIIYWKEPTVNHNIDYRVITIH